MDIGIVIGFCGVAIALAGVMVSIHFSSKSVRTVETTRTEDSTYNMATIEVTLKTVGEDVKEIRKSIESIKNKQDTFNERLILVEQKADTAHIRIDGIKRKRKN